MIIFFIKKSQIRCVCLAFNLFTVLKRPLRTLRPILPLWCSRSRSQQSYLILLISLILEHLFTLRMYYVHYGCSGGRRLIRRGLMVHVYLPRKVFLGVHNRLGPSFCGSILWFVAQDLLGEASLISIG